MRNKKNIFAIIGSASANSSNLTLVNKLAELTGDAFHWTIFNDLKTLPHFDPELSTGDSPQPIKAFRECIEKADGIIICTPEYVFSIPSGLKNAIEWCVSTTVFSDKPTGLITASAHGQKGQEELQLIMQTLMAKFTAETTLLIQGVKGKVTVEGEIKDDQTKECFLRFANAFTNLVVEGDSTTLI